MNFDLYLKEKREKIDKELTKYLPFKDEYPKKIHEAMHYSLFAGGKRIRPILVIATAELFGENAEKAMPFACAIEFIHTYSLIHDDLPALDNDDYRRGILTNHKVFGEAIAILAGDALLTQAFITMSKDYKDGVSAEKRLRIINTVSEAVGSLGMVGGQVMDLECENKDVSIDTVSDIYDKKTAALIRASVVVGAIIGGANEKEMERLSKYGHSLGRLFQLVDDLLDVLGDKKYLGKEVRKDAARGKATYPSIIGVDEAKKEAKVLCEEAVSHLSIFEGGKVIPLREMAYFVLKRTN